MKDKKNSILADTKELLKHIFIALLNTPKVNRIEGALVEMKRAALDIIDHFSKAYYCEKIRITAIQYMIGDYSKLLACFDIALEQGLIIDSKKLPIAELMDKINTAIDKWYKYVQNRASK